MGTACLKPNNISAVDSTLKHKVSLNHRDSDDIDLEMEQSAMIESSYIPLKCIGKGTFGQVLLVKQRSSGNYYAMKVINKTILSKQKHFDHLHTEKEILETVKHPFMIELHDCFQSRRKIFFVMHFANGGNLKYHLCKKRKFSMVETQFYGAEILLALDHLHKKGYIYRDLKLENVLIDAEGHIKLVDFGVAKKLEDLPDGERQELTGTYWGTPEYLAPEVRMKKKYDKSVDFWSFGVLLHTMLYGRMPKSSKKNRDSIDIKFPDPDFNDSTKDDTHPFIRYIIQSSFDCIHLILQ